MKYKKSPKRIVILPEFASSHFLKCAIPNWIDILEPDIVLINSGIFPSGPENKGHIDDDFKRKWCYKDTNAGFDYDETLDFVSQLTIERHAGNKKIPHIECRVINYKSQDANECFLEAITTGLDGFVEEGSLIFPFEPDCFVWEGDKDKINELVDNLEIGHGISTKWVDFLQTQHYTECINVKSPKYRRFCYKFDNMTNYNRAMSGFMSQDYPLLKKTDEFFCRHYCWIVSDEWKELRYELIWRRDDQYWKDFETGLQEIQRKTQEYLEHTAVITLSNSPIFGKNWNGQKVQIRPSRQDEGRWASFIDVPHPRHIMNHPNFVK